MSCETDQAALAIAKLIERLMSDGITIKIDYPAQITTHSTMITVRVGR